ncbi:hypothetical protein HBI38_049490 [Parastagonospora nodorum]|nr:hypothetical protein HBH75_079650 [Parastagonospora nodorum]KAH4967867.1 hypothetical protein HBI78_075090 [Parastagonospora nodorum]KAH5042063.1 hypothetical protein HBI75_041910 [Parastagonospora nodorum]KAH5060233.1 hypothetical protein HBH96_083740 [Parastagonospora nodorum]KAH5096271.1 hypothetical protein HBH72_141900 [Parastagonospora nodorum]
MFRYTRVKKDEKVCSCMSSIPPSRRNPQIPTTHHIHFKSHTKTLPFAPKPAEDSIRRPGNSAGRTRACRLPKRQCCGSKDFGTHTKTAGAALESCVGRQICQGWVQDVCGVAVEDSICLTKVWMGRRQSCSSSERKCENWRGEIMETWTWTS